MMVLRAVPLLPNKWRSVRKRNQSGAGGKNLRRLREDGRQVSRSRLAQEVVSVGVLCVSGGGCGAVPLVVQGVGGHGSQHSRRLNAGPGRSRKLVIATGPFDTEADGEDLDGWVQRLGRRGLLHRVVAGALGASAGDGV